MEYWVMDTHGDPLGTLRELVRKIWDDAGLEAMLVAPNRGGKTSAAPRYITAAESIDEINPFTPLMEMNLAKLIPGFLDQYPAAKVAVILRPCEMRALNEMIGHTSINLENMLSISVDCLGTLPADEYQWRLERLDKPHAAQTDRPDAAYDDLAREALAFARQGGIIPYRYRSACQVCNSSAANQADINVHILGVPVRQQILISVRGSNIASKLHFEKPDDGSAANNLVTQHERVLSKMAERHARAMERVEEGLSSTLPADVDAVCQQLESCGECQACLNVCPICSVDRPYRNADGHYDRTDVMRWLVSCAGCGMCEQACPSHLPTAAIFTHIRQLLAEDWKDLPGRSTDVKLSLV